MTRAKDISKITTDANFGGTLDVAGTVTAGAVAVEGASGAQITITDNSPSTVSLYMGAGNSSVSIGSTTSDPVTFLTANTERMRISAGGDISFYEDTGTTPKLFWDASAERLGIGNASPSSPLHISLPSSGTDVEGWRVSSGGGGILYVRVDDASSANPTWEMNVASSEQLAFGIGASEAMRIDDSRNVGIGTGSPATNLHIAGTGTGLPATSGTTQTYGRIRTSGSGSNAVLDIGNAGATGAWLQVTNQTSLGVEYPLLLNPNGGNVGIGTSSPDSKLDVATGANGVIFRYDTASTFLQILPEDANGDISLRYRANSGSAPDLLFKNDGGTERMRLDNGGNLQVSAGQFTVGTTGTTGLQFINDGTFGTIHTADLKFRTASAERMRIDSSGRMLLNTTAHTNGRLNVTENLSTQPCLGLRSNYSANTGNFVLFTSDNGTGAGAISHINASTVAYNTSSDYRLKQNVTYDFDATTRLKQLQPARFSWNHDDTNTLVDGFLAHEVQSVVPEAITGNKDAVDADGNPVYQGIDQSKLVPLLVKTIQELEARIVALETA